MKDVYFKREKEVISFCESLFRHNKEIELNWKVHPEWGNQLQFKGILLNDSIFESMALAMVDVYHKHRLNHDLQEMIQTEFYYSSQEEIEKIFDLSYILYREARKNSQINPRQLLFSLFIKNIKNNSPIHYDSIVKFRLQSFRNMLLDYVGLAIDEFKQEEDYQAFIDMLRKYIEKKEPIYKEIYILQGEDFSFFKSNGRQISMIELRRLIHLEPLYMTGLDVEELNLSPLIAISPTRIHIYGNNPSESKTLTVINVFQERVTFKALSHFPFPHYLETKSFDE